MGLSSSKKRNRRAKRDASAVANHHPHQAPTLGQLLSPALSPLKPISSPKPKNLRPLEDRRTYHPQGKVRPARSLNKSQHKLVAAGKSNTFAGYRSPPVKVGFSAPKKVLICIRRNMRKQVLFALGKTGKGAKARRHRRSYYSSVRC